MEAGAELFQKYLRKHNNKVRHSSTDGFYPVNVVAEAYSQGFEDGSRSGQKDFVTGFIKREVDKFTDRANQVYILSKVIISHLAEKGYRCGSLHLNFSLGGPRVLLAYPGVQMLDDAFVELAYAKVFEAKDIYDKLFGEHLDMGLVSSTDLDHEVLQAEGFDYKEQYDGQA